MTNALNTIHPSLGFGNAKLAWALPVPLKRISCLLLFVTPNQQQPLLNRRFWNVNDRPRSPAQTTVRGLPRLGPAGGETLRPTIAATGLPIHTLHTPALEAPLGPWQLGEAAEMLSLQSGAGGRRRHQGSK